MKITYILLSAALTSAIALLGSVSAKEPGAVKCTEPPCGLFNKCTSKSGDDKFKCICGICLDQRYINTPACKKHPECLGGKKASVIGPGESPDDDESYKFNGTYDSPMGVDPNLPGTAPFRSPQKGDDPAKVPSTIDRDARLKRNDNVDLLFQNYEDAGNEVPSKKKQGTK